MKDLSKLSVGELVELDAVLCTEVIPGQEATHKAKTLKGEDNPNAGSFFYRMQFKGINFNVDNKTVHSDFEKGNVVKCTLEVTEYTNRAGDTVKGWNLISHVTMAQYANAQKNQAMMKKMQTGNFFDKVDFLATLDLVELSEASA